MTLKQKIIYQPAWIQANFSFIFPSVAEYVKCVFVLAGVHVKSGVLSGIAQSTWRGMKFKKMQGDMNQQGGALILGPGKSNVL